MLTKSCLKVAADPPYAMDTFDDKFRNLICNFQNSWFFHGFWVDFADFQTIPNQYMSICWPRGQHIMLTKISEMLKQYRISLKLNL